MEEEDEELEDKRGDKKRHGFTKTTGKWEAEEIEEEEEEEEEG